MSQCLPEVSTEPAFFQNHSVPLHQATCECGWKGRRRKDWNAACDEADAHAQKSAASPSKSEDSGTGKKRGEQ